MYGPICTVVWEGEGREAGPYPIFLAWHLLKKFFGFLWQVAALDNYHSRSKQDMKTSFSEKHYNSKKLLNKATAQNNWVQTSTNTISSEENTYGRFFGNLTRYARESELLSWTFCNQGHVDFAYNWWYHFSTTCPEYYPFVVSISEKTCQKLDKLGVPNVYFRPAFDVSDLEANYMQSANWSRIMAVKIDITYTLLKKGFTVFYTDDDVILRLSLTTLIQKYLKDENLDIAFQKNHMGNLCAGVFWVRPKEKTQLLFDRYANNLPSYNLDSENNEGDQPFLTKRIYHMKNELSLHYFPTDKFPNGAIWYRYKEEIKDRAILVHYNCIVGKAAKIEKMKEDNAWKYLPENTSEQELFKTYDRLHQTHLGIEQNKRNCARKILDILFDVYRPKSVLDVGCGLGTFLAVAEEKGVENIRGLEGYWLDPNRVQIDKSKINQINLENGFSLEEKFELVICLEVAEHLNENSAEVLINSLIRHAPLILFSAAIPYQGGVHHVNEQFPDYWSKIFSKYDYWPIDLIRGRIWGDDDFSRYHLHLCQNTLVFAHVDIIQNNKKLRELRECERKDQLSIVHPSIYLSRLNQAYKQLGQGQELISLLSLGGDFRVTRKNDGELFVQRIE